jgi:hypothetical protein
MEWKGHVEKPTVNSNREEDEDNDFLRALDFVDAAPDPWRGLLAPGYAGPGVARPPRPMSRAHTRHRRHGAEERRALARMLEGGRAHAAPAESLLAFPRALRGVKPRGAPHTPWELLEHMRIAQRDILDFGRDPEHPSPPFPEGFWPASATPPDARAWDRSARAFLKDLRALATVARTRHDLAASIPGTVTSWFGQLCLAASHNSYHLGQLFLLRRALEATRRK